MSRYQVAVVGGGVAGLSAALFLARATISVAVYDQHESSLYRVSRVNNYLGFPDGIGGPELIDLGRRQAARFGATLRDEDVVAISRAPNGFALSTTGEPSESDYVILASNKRTDIAQALGLELGGHGARFVSVDADGQTAVDRVYAAGRLTGLPSQANISAGDGAKVAISIIERVRGGYYVDHDT
ncbi:MAG: FAD-dependent oxidoreductase [Candidatus Eremiobacteraeota bacterium]|nr:FAD-dependent oxidoreductase [Candidatus Eremiobacteraeota bacterium]MBV8222609.1 FAD-dependent oxidoreductase [Candidatus Eremiobacteraeota bacterium]